MVNQRCKLLVAAMVAGASGTAFGGDILYDALLRDITEPLPYDNDYDWVLSFIGGLNIVGKSYDTQNADDFELAAESTITKITVDTNSGLVSREYRRSC